MMMEHIFPGKYCFFILSLLLPGVDYAQLGAAGGFEYGTPILVNKSVFIRRPSVGICAMVSYCPPEGRLFPSLSYLKKNIIVPVHNSAYEGQDDNAAEDNFVLNLNYRTTDKEHYTLVFAGIGVANIIPQHSLNDKLGNPMQLRDTGSITLYPLMQAGCRYMRRILPNSNFYLGLETDIKYIRMRSDNVYYIWQGSSATRASIGGNVIFPGVQVYLQYFFGKESED
jgi:hypothetical protein